LLSVKNGGYTLLKDTDYTVNGLNITFKQAYLNTLNADAQTFTFTMSGGMVPAFTIMISSEAPEAEITEDGVPLAPPNPFGDIAASAWYYDAVMYMYENNLMIGAAEDTFSPDADLSRAMIATILYRLAGEPDTGGYINPFGDVDEGQWYSDAVKWGYDRGVVFGYENGLFGTDDPVTKEQLAALVYRFQQTDGWMPPNTDNGGVVIKDADTVSYWAVDAVDTLNNQGLFDDIPGPEFYPQKPASRAEVASILYRYCIDIYIDTQNLVYMGT
jgi:hypothetical protein